MGTKLVVVSCDELPILFTTCQLSPTHVGSLKLGAEHYCLFALDYPYSLSR